MSSQDLHARVRRAFPAFAASLLDASQAARMREHLESCEPCRTAWDTYSNPEGAPPSEDLHIPPPVLAQWERSRTNLRGLQRSMVRRHLAWCADCRQDLEVLGFTPTLEWIPELEASIEGGDEGELQRPHELVRPLGPAATSDRNVIMLVQGGTRRTSSRWLPWVSGGWAAVATAALVLLLLRPAGWLERRSAPEGDTLPWVSPQLLRGEGGSDIGTALAGVRTLAVSVPVPIGVPPETHPYIQIFSPRGDTLLTLAVAPVDLERRSVMVVLRNRNGLPAGRYRVVFWKGDPVKDGVDSSERWFELIPAQR